jgi:Ca2+/Na+ antiporter
MSKKYTTINREANETPYQKTMRTMVWPILSAFVGFAWLISRNKAIEVAAKISAKAATKKARKIVNSISKILNRPTSTTIDLVFIMLVILLNFYMWYDMCEYRKEEALYALVAIFIGVIVINYMIVSYSTGGLLLMTPLLLYVFILLQDEARARYKKNQKEKIEKKESNINSESN